MEMVRLYETGFEWRLSREDLAELGIISSGFEQIPFERELISQFFKNATEGAGFAEFLTSTEIKDYIESNSIQ